MRNYHEFGKRSNYNDDILKQCIAETNTIEHIASETSLSREAKDFLQFYITDLDKLEYIKLYLELIFKKDNNSEIKVKFGKYEFKHFENLLTLFADKREETIYQTANESGKPKEKIQLLHLITTHNKDYSKSITCLIVPKYIKDFISCIEILNKSNSQLNLSLAYLLFSPSNLIPRTLIEENTNIQTINKIFIEVTNNKNHYIDYGDNLSKNEISFLQALYAINSL